MSERQVAVLEQRQRELADRLEAGFVKIGEAMAEGVGVRDWERFWVQLLREYEAVSDELAAAQRGPVVQAEMPLGVRAEQVA